MVTPIKHISSDEIYPTSYYDDKIEIFKRYLHYNHFYYVSRKFNFLEIR